METARSLARAGARVTLAVRNVEAGHKTAEDIALSTGNNSVRVAHLDLGDLASVAEFVAAWDGSLDLLINNAGIMALPERTLTPNGWEMQFATNHIGHFALTSGLHSALAAGADLHDGARIVSVSSGGHMRSPVIFDDINFDNVALTTPGAPTASPKQPMSCLPWKPPAAGRATASSPTPSCPAAL